MVVFAGGDLFEVSPLLVAQHCLGDLLSYNDQQQRGSHDEFNILGVKFGEDGSTHRRAQGLRVRTAGQGLL
jgi:hypothetical protein